MNMLKLIATLAVMATLAACGDKDTCTQEVATQKATDLMTTVQGLAASDPSKLAALAPKMQELQAKLAGAGDDPEAVCAAIDEIQAELDK
jgi:hypothetical protein